MGSLASVKILKTAKAELFCFSNFKKHNPQVPQCNTSEFQLVFNCPEKCKHLPKPTLSISRGHYCQLLKAPKNVRPEVRSSKAKETPTGRGIYLNTQK